MTLKLMRRAPSLAMSHMTPVDTQMRFGKFDAELQAMSYVFYALKPYKTLNCDSP